MKLRHFTESGIQEFRKFLAACRENPATEVPVSLLGDSRYAKVVEHEIEIEDQSFGTKCEAANYLREVLRPIADDELTNDAGLWTWLSLFYFDQICPPDASGFNPKNDYRYVYEPFNQRHFYRHLLFISWYILKTAPVHNQLMLSTPLSMLDKVTEEVMKRLYITRIPCIFELLERLYWDSSANRSKTGIVSQKAKPGDLKGRLPIRIRQLEKTYDLHSLSADQLLELLGEEFQHWLSPPSPRRSKSARQPA